MVNCVFLSPVNINVQKDLASSYVTWVNYMHVRQQRSINTVSKDYVCLVAQLHKKQITKRIKHL